MNEILNENICLNEEIKKYLRHKKQKINIKTKDMDYKLFILTDGSDKASESYMKSKIKTASYVNIAADVKRIKDVNDIIAWCQVARQVGAKTILQKPCSEELERAYAKFGRDLDVDGFFTFNDTVNGDYKNSPCTPTGIINFLSWKGYPLRGKNVVIVGRGFLVGKPLSIQMINAGATVSVINTKTEKDLRAALLYNADVVILCTGQYGSVKASELKRGSIVFDVGITFHEGQIRGEFEEDFQNGIHYTKTPGGVGKITVMQLMENVVGGLKENGD